MTASSDEEAADAGSSTVRLVSIAHGSIVMDDAPQHPQRQLSWSDFDALMQRSKNMQERIESLEQQQLNGAEGVGLLEGEEKDGVVPGSRDRRLSDGAGGASRSQEQTESMIDARNDEYEMPESTYTLLTTEKVLSVPFFTGIIAAAMSLWCLAIALKNELDNGSPGNPFGLPAGVQPEVRMAQYLGVIIGVLMEEEIPQGLEIIGKGAEQEISGGNRWSMRRIVAPSLIRLAVGYTFLCCLFLVVVQESTVLDIFFDVLALEFVENIDDVIFGLCKRGFFGRRLKVATNNTHVIQGSRQSRAFRRWTKRFIRLVYIVNMLVGIGLLTYVTTQQDKGAYRCQRVIVNFGDAHWEDALVTINGKSEKRLLIYSHFNGVYVEDGSHHGRPKYTEQNKEDGDEFKETTPAEIVYCEDIESWVFRHKYIKTTEQGGEDTENECDWLLRSPQTESYDIIELSEEDDWFIWKGLVEPHEISIECNECDDAGDCNYQGECSEESECVCKSSHFGSHCQFTRPCDVIRSEKDSNMTLSLLPDPKDEEGVTFVEVYGRPMYVVSNLAGKPHGLLRLGYPDDDDAYFDVEYANGTGALPSHKHYHADFFEDDDFFEVNNQTESFQQLMTNYTFVLRYTGRRWYGQLQPPGWAGANFEEEEYHAFWNNSFSRLGDEDNSTLIISEPSSDFGSPVGIDFYEMRRRNVAFEGGSFDYQYGPFGVLLPLIEYDGSGFFHCNKPDNNAEAAG